MMTQPKYSIAEIERRWLVNLAEIGSLDDQPFREIEDLYVAGTQLRLRKIEGNDGEPVFKFCKKYGRSTGVSESITNLYLSESEYKVLSQLPGALIKKRRYTIGDGALDLYESPNAGLAIYEVEFECEMAAIEYQPPRFACVEITDDIRYHGASLAWQQVQSSGNSLPLRGSAPSH